MEPSTTSKSAKSNVAKWSGQDRRLLFVYLEKYGAGNWTAAANFVPGKTSKQVSESLKGIEVADVVQCRDQWMYISQCL
jgi:hypothetical protein